MTRFVSGWLSAFCVIEIATGHLWLAAITGVTAAVLLATAHVTPVRDTEARRLGVEDFDRWLDRVRTAMAARDRVADQRRSR